MNIIIVDYGLGNLYSLSNAFSYCGREVYISSDANEILKADALILPGVGAFGDGMQRLNEKGLNDAIRQFANRGGMMLGICLGMQLLMNWSEEFGFHEGLGLIQGGVKHLHSLDSFDKETKVPHIGWNDILLKKDTRLLDGLKSKDMYFVHSFFAATECTGETLATVSYGGAEFASVIGKGNVFGCQFHPEKSSSSGIKIVNNFIDMVKEERNG